MPCPHRSGWDGVRSAQANTRGSSISGTVPLASSIDTTAVPFSPRGMPVVGGLVRHLSDPSRGSVSVPFVCHTLWRILAVSAPRGVGVPSPDYFSWDDARVTERALLLRPVQRAPVRRGAGGCIRRRIASTSVPGLSGNAAAGVSGLPQDRGSPTRRGPGRSRPFPCTWCPVLKRTLLPNVPYECFCVALTPVSLPTPRQQRRGGSGPICRHRLSPSYDGSQRGLSPSSSPVPSVSRRGRSIRCP